MKRWHIVFNSANSSYFVVIANEKIPYCVEESNMNMWSACLSMYTARTNLTLAITHPEGQNYAVIGQLVVDKYTKNLCHSCSIDLVGVRRIILVKTHAIFRFCKLK